MHALAARTRLAAAAYRSRGSLGGTVVLRAGTALGCAAGDKVVSCVQRVCEQASPAHVPPQSRTHARTHPPTTHPTRTNQGSPQVLHDHQAPPERSPVMAGCSPRAGQCLVPPARRAVGRGGQAGVRPEGAPEVVRPGSRRTTVGRVQPRIGAHLHSASAAYFGALAHHSGQHRCPCFHAHVVVHMRAQHLGARLYSAASPYRATHHQRARCDHADHAAMPTGRTACAWQGAAARRCMLARGGLGAHNRVACAHLQCGWRGKAQPPTTSWLTAS